MQISLNTLNQFTQQVLALLLGLLLSFQIFAAPYTIDQKPIQFLTKQLQRAILQKDDPLAQNTLNKLKQIAPHQAQTYCAKIRYQVANNQLVVAQQTFSELKKLTQAHSCQTSAKKLIATLGELKPTINQARLLAMTNQPQKAIELYDQIFSQDFPSLEYQLEYIKWLEASTIDPKQVKQAYQKLIEAFSDLAELDLAYADFLLKQSPENQNAYHKLTQYARDERYRLYVEDIWIRAINRLPHTKNSQQWVKLFKTYYPRSAKGQLAIEQFEQAYQYKQMQLADPGYSAWFKGQKLSEQGLFQQAQALFNTALKRHPKDAQIHASQALLYMRTGQHKKAQIHYSKALALAPKAFEANTWQLLLNTAKYWEKIAQVRDAINKNNPDLAQKILAQATKIEPDELANMYYQGEIARLTDKPELAKQLFQNVLRQNPNHALAQLGMLNLLESKADIEQIRKFYTDLSAGQQVQMKPEFNRIMAEKYREAGAQALSNNQTMQAIAILSEGINKLSYPAWLSFDLANIYAEHNHLQKAMTVFSKQYPQALNSPEFVYANALFLGRENQYQAAVDLIKRSGAKSQSITQLQKQYQEQLIYQNLAQKIINNAKNPAAQSTDIIDLTSGLSQSQTLNLAKLAYTNNQAYLAISLIQNQIRPSNSSVDVLPLNWQLEYCNWLFDEGYTAAFKKHFSKLTLGLNATQTELEQWGQLNQLYARYTQQSELSRIKQLANQYPNSQVPTQLLAQYYLTKKQLNKAQPHIDLLNSADKLPVELAISYLELKLTNSATTFNKADKSLLNDIISQKNTLSLYQKKRVLKLLPNQENTQQVAIAKQWVTQHPEDFELMYWAAQVAEAENQTQLVSLWQQKISQTADTSAWYYQNTLNQIEQAQIKNEAWFELGIQSSRQTSTNTGESVSQSTIPLTLWLPYNQGHFFTKLDLENIQDPTLQLLPEAGINNFGTGLLCQSNCIDQLYKKQDQGVDLAVGWQGTNWRFNVGISPAGFKINNLLFGIEYQGAIQDWSYAIELERNALNDSVLAYAGLGDPYSNKQFGGVRRTGLNINLSHDLGKQWGFWGLTDFYQYEGENVKSNQSYSLMGGTYYRFYQGLNHEVSLGTNLLHWAYQYNLSGETLGHGGYYSPQSYWGLSLPITFQGNWHKLSYQVTAATSWSTSKEDAIAYFPADATLQQQAQQLSDQSNVTPFFSADKNSGIGYRFAATLEYKLNQKWVIGGYFSAQKANAYQPINGQLYLRYYFGRSPSRLYTPPKPVTPYQSF